MKSLYGILLLLALSLGFCSCSNSTDTDLKNVVNGALTFSKKQYLLMAKKYEAQEGMFPKSFENGEDTKSDSRWWCSGFFPGSLWYLYEDSQSPEVLKYAELFTDRVEREKYTTDNHDLGFMIFCSFGNGYRLTHKEHYKDVILMASKSLSTRYHPKVGLIRSWDWNQDTWQYPVIIDNIMNLEMLLWTSNNSDNDTFRQIAVSHANKTMEYQFRDDYSSYHLVSYDTITATPELRGTHQGYSDESAWSRGQSWGLYGYTYLYRETKDERYLEHAKHIANYIINHPRMPEDYIPYWDYDSPNIPKDYRDVSAATVMASALIELSDYVDAELAKSYMSVVETQIRTLASKEYTAELGANGCFILKHSVGALPLNSEIDAPLTYADYYYLEALMRLKNKLK